MSIVITGTPGVGKHTITKEIARIKNWNITDITEVAKKFDCIEENEGINEVDVSKLAAHLEGTITENSLVVGHLAPYVVNKEDTNVVIVLRRNPYSLISIYEERNYPNSKIKENLGSEILGVIAFDTIKKFQEKAIQLDVSQRTISETVEEVIKIISRNKKTEEVDWLSLITKKNDLKKFFDD